MAFKCLLLLLPALAVARIEFDVSGTYKNDDLQDIKIKYYGSEVGLITDLERTAFGINEDGLKRAVEAYFGQRPSDAYLRSPTPWGDLYTTYGWDQVIVTLVPKSARLVSLSQQPMIVLRQIFENKSSKPATFDVGIHQQVQNSISTSWYKDSDISVGQDINCGFSFFGVGVSGSGHMEYKTSWGQSGERNETVIVGSMSAMEMLLQPNQAVVSLLESHKGSLKLEVEYEASLSGIVAVNYQEAYKGHHFWSLDIRAVLNAAGIENSVRSKQIVEASMFLDSKILVNDKAIGTLMLQNYF